jgi:anti-sigma factor RsiW
VRCEQLERLIEAIADGTLEPAPEDRAHLETCERCSARLDQARRIEQWLLAREVPLPPTSFTAAVMARIGQEHWKTERVVDIGFNLAVAAAVLVIIVGAAGAAWSLGFVTITIDSAALLRAAMSEVEGRVLNEVQSVFVAAVVLTMALVLWWWAEAATD